MFVKDHFQPGRLMRAPTRASRAGSTLVTALMTICVLSFVAVNVLLSVSSRYNSAYRSGSWNEALVTAEAGVDITMSEILRAVPDVRVTNAGLGVGFSQPSLGLLTGLQISPTGLVTNGTLLNLNPPQLVHGGEGGTTQQATVSIDVVPLSTLLSGGLTGTLNSVGTLLGGNDLQLLRLRSTGTVFLTGGTLAGPSRQDNDLWRVSLLTDRSTGAPLTQPTVSRQIEVILRPTFAFESAVTSDGALLATDPGTVFDSFNSTLPTASTNGQYDSLKRRANATTRSNGAIVTLAGKVWGNVDTNGASVPQDSHVTGTVNNNTSAPLPPVNPPGWTSFPPPSLSVSGPTILAAGTVVLPAQYRFTGITSSLHITRGPAGLGTNVQIYVNGDITGGIEVDPGVTAQVYVTGSISTNASQLKNDTGLAANLQIYGLPTGTGSTPSIRINLDAPLTAAVYAPGHSVSFIGNNDVSGSIVAASFQAAAAMRFHYDESLAFTVGPLVGYQIASWKELTN